MGQQAKIQPRCSLGHEGRKAGIPRATSVAVADSHCPGWGSPQLAAPTQCSWPPRGHLVTGGPQG